MDNARYGHDCNECTFLGQFNEYDLYFCPQGTRPTVIARWSSNGPDYISGMALVIISPVLAEAYNRAKDLGLVTSNAN